MPWDGVERYRPTDLRLRERAIEVDLQELTLVWADTREALTRAEHRAVNAWARRLEAYQDAREGIDRQWVRYASAEMKDRILAYVQDREAAGERCRLNYQAIGRALGLSDRAVTNGILALAEEGQVWIVVEQAPKRKPSETRYHRLLTTCKEKE